MSDDIDLLFFIHVLYKVQVSDNCTLFLVDLLGLDSTFFDFVANLVSFTGATFSLPVLLLQILPPIVFHGHLPGKYLSLLKSLFIIFCIIFWVQIIFIMFNLIPEF